MARIKINIEDLFNLPSAVIYNPDSFVDAADVSIDSRSINKNSIFFAIKGEKLDGHDFVEKAVENGAGTIVINSSKLKKFDTLDCTIVTVDDTTEAFGRLANCWRKKLTAKVISITGSNGKTSTKDILATLLLEKFKVVKTHSNNNNHIGVPLTIFSANEKTEFLILELGTNHFGEIEYTAQIAEPDYSLITNISDSHLEFLRDIYGVLEEKQKLFNVTEKCNGTVFINLDDRLLKGIRRQYSKIITYGFKAEPNFKGDLLGFTPEGKTRVKISFEDKYFDFVLPLYGSASARNFLASAAVALNVGLTPDDLLAALNKLKPAKGRLVVTELKDHIIIDDTYNSNPASMENAIELMKKIKKFKRRILIAGDMKELGKASFEKHVSLYKAVQKGRVTEIYTIGKMMGYLSLKLEDMGYITKHFANRTALAKFVKSLDVSNSVVLVKGSRGMKMEEFICLIDKKGN